MADKHTALKSKACDRMANALARFTEARTAALAQDSAAADLAAVAASRGMCQTTYENARSELTNAVAEAEAVNVDTSSKADAEDALALPLVDIRV